MLLCNSSLPTPQSPGPTDLLSVPKYELEPKGNRMEYHVFAWLLSLGIIILRSTGNCWAYQQLVSLDRSTASRIQVNHVLFIHWPLGGHLGCLQLAAIIDCTFVSHVLFNDFWDPLSYWSLGMGVWYCFPHWTGEETSADTYPRSHSKFRSELRVSNVRPLCPLVPPFPEAQCRKGNFCAAAKSTECGVCFPRFQSQLAGGQRATSLTRPHWFIDFRHP